MWLLQVGAVSHVDFSPVYPFHCAVTSSTRVIIYDALTRQARSLTTAQDSALKKQQAFLTFFFAAETETRLVYQHLTLRGILQAQALC